jgi:hypothetical protein
MRCLRFGATMMLIAGPVLADPGLVPLRGLRYAVYDPATGELTPAGRPARSGNVVWSATQATPWYLSTFDEGWTVLDWGDIAGPQEIGGFSFAYGTDVVWPSRLDVIVVFYADENGWNSTNRTYLRGFRIPDLPGADLGPPPQSWGWVVTVELDPDDVFTIDGADLDGDGLVDFGYTYWFDGISDPDSQTGPVLVSDPNVTPSPAPGIENGYDAFSDPNLFNYVGTYWWL